jgi:hypothetical protein
MASVLQVLTISARLKRIGMEMRFVVDPIGICLAELGHRECQTPEGTEQRYPGRQSRGAGQLIGALIGGPAAMLTSMQDLVGHAADQSRVMGQTRDYAVR